jgi:hypothetical protein
MSQRSLPVITSKAANNATGVATNSAIQIQFNKVMNPLTITGSTITLLNGSVSIGGALTVNAAARGFQCDATMHHMISSKKPERTDLQASRKYFAFLGL